jgi:hypothetical protein
MTRHDIPAIASVAYMFFAAGIVLGVGFSYS